MLYSTRSGKSVCPHCEVSSLRPATPRLHVVSFAMYKYARSLIRFCKNNFPHDWFAAPRPVAVWKRASAAAPTIPHPRSEDPDALLPLWFARRKWAWGPGGGAAALPM